MPRKKRAILTKVESIGDLQYRCQNDEKKEKYQKLAIISAQNLGCDKANPTLEEAIKWLKLTAAETHSDEIDGEQGVTDEINFCIDLVD